MIGNQFAPAERPLLISYRNDDRLSFHSLVRLIGRNGFRVETSAAVNDDEMLLRLAPARKLAAVSPCSVAVLSGGMTFGERLGRQMIASLLPGEALPIAPSDLPSAEFTVAWSIVTL